MLDKFAELGELYPGSRQRRQTVAPLPVPAVDDGLLGEPVIYVVNGRNTEFFLIGQVARALGRKPATLRKWEDGGITLRPQYDAPSHDPRGIRRLYSRAEAEGMVRIAKATGIMNSRAPLADFGRQVRALFKELAKGVK